MADPNDGVEKSSAPPPEALQYRVTFAALTSPPRQYPAAMPSKRISEAARQAPVAGSRRMAW